MTEPSKDWEGFLNELQNETPRASVIVGAAFLDARLHELLSNFLIEDKRAVQDLLGSDKKADRPLSAFSARINAAYCLGLISQIERDDLHLIRRIRNRFAHRLHDLSFDDDEIINWCHSLKIPKNVLLPEISHSHRILFITGVTLLAQQIALRALQASRKRLKRPKPFEVIKEI